MFLQSLLQWKSKRIILWRFVDLGTQYAMRPIAKCGLPGCTIFFHILRNATIFNKNFTEHKMCV